MTLNEATIPEGMVEVSHDKFFEILYADPRDIMPSHRHEFYTLWETKNREVWGWSFPGWKNPGQSKRYAVLKNAVRS